MTTATFDLLPLDKKLRKKLESAIKDARDVVEEAARAACTQLGIAQAEPDSHLSEEDRDLRRRLRIHGRQLGDQRNATKKTQEIDRLVEEIGYQHWHRMLFARFLAENKLLMYPDPEDPVPVTLSDCEDLAEEEGAKNGWELAARYAAKMLPQIFRVDSPVFSLALPTENQQQLEKILSDLPTEVFTASDSLGWVYQFWQAKRKKEVNDSEVKIGARELPAVTQLFTEPYMVSFLLDNSLGAWWAARRLTEEDFRTAACEQELREKAALPGVPLEYLRFVRTPSGDEVEGEENTGPWTPAAGTFDAWPESLSELKTLDPCCGSGHFLVAGLLMLTPIRMELEGLTATEAVDCVLSENLHGLEIDQRCVELAAFALALAAWRFPSEDAAGGYRVLPNLNVACCGLSVSVAKEEWKELARDNKQLKIALDWMYDEFKDAPVLGSLLNPARSMAARVVKWEELCGTIEQALSVHDQDESNEAAVVAYGLSRASVLLGKKYTLAMTNVPYLSKKKQSPTLSKYCHVNHSAAKSDLATVFLDRCLNLVDEGGTTVTVIPQNWLFMSSYRKFRERLLIRDTWNLLARLGPKGFTTPMWDLNIQLLTVSRGKPVLEEFEATNHRIIGLDVTDANTAEEKSERLSDATLVTINQQRQLDDPDKRIKFVDHGHGQVINELADCYQGLLTGDIQRFTRKAWESPFDIAWVPFRRSCVNTDVYSDVSDVLFWQLGKGQLHHYAKETRDKLHDMHESGNRAWGKRGIAINRMANLRTTAYYGAHFDNNVAVVSPKKNDDILALLAFFQSDDFPDAVRALDQKLNVTNATLIKVSCDFAHWQKVASEKYPHGLPEPYSDDPTQWIFHGHPASSTDVLQVAVSRLLGYRWPTELDAEMDLATDARAWVTQSSQLYDSSQNDTADNDGIVCIPAVGTEQPAEDRLLNLLNRAYEQGRVTEQVFREKLADADENDPITIDLWRRGWQPSLPDNFVAWQKSLMDAVGYKDKTLESWLRDKFFTQHLKRFKHPFIWQIWDGLKDGFSALVNYHKLDTKTLETLIYTYLNTWINNQKNSSEDGHEERVAASESLKLKLEKILEGESPHDIFVRWKPLSEQPIGWNPDLNDGVRLNIRPWMTVGDVKKKGAGVLRDKPNCKWTKDRGKDVESAPWYHLGPEYDGKEGDRINDHHLTLKEKQEARK